MFPATAELGANITDAEDVQAAMTANRVNFFISFPVQLGSNVEIHIEHCKFCRVGC